MMTSETNKTETKPAAEKDLASERRAESVEHNRELYDLLFGIPGEFPACDWNI